MGRAPCCDKANVKKGPWSPEEDAKLKSYIDQNGTGGNWIALPQKIGLKRCGKSCRLRWLNYLRPNIKHGGFSEEEDNIICNLYINIGSRWSIIAAQLPGRTDNDIKNYWNTKLKKKLVGKQRKEQASQARRSAKLDQMKRQNQYQYNHTTSPFENNNISTIVVDHHLPSDQHGLFETTSQTPYWPDLQAINPMPSVANQTYNINNNYNNNNNVFSQLRDDIGDEQASIKNLLVKLGGKFSDTAHQDEQAASSLDMLSTTSNHYYGGGDHQNMYFQLGLESLQAELSELINYRSYQQEEVLLDGDNNYASNKFSEGFYEIEQVVTGSSTTSTTSSATFDSSSSSPFVYTPCISDYVQLPHHQDCGFVDQDQSRCYFGTNYSMSSL